MAREPDWSRRDFELLLQHTELADDELGGSVSGVCQMMKRRLEREVWVCPVCHEVR
jgi:hypothetical protein